jgi:hypothetical protein
MENVNTVFTLKQQLSSVPTQETLLKMVSVPNGRLQIENSSKSSLTPEVHRISLNVSEEQGKRAETVNPPSWS